MPSLIETNVSALQLLGVGVEVDPDAARIHATDAVNIAPGVVRAGVLAALADCVSGVHALRELAEGSPLTADLTLHATGRPAASGAVVATSRLLRRRRAGAVFEVAVHDDAPGGERLALSTVTYALRVGERPRGLLDPIDAFWPPTEVCATLAEAIAPRVGDDGDLLLDIDAGVRNAAGVLNGGVTTVLVELGAEHALAPVLGPVQATDLVVHYLAPGAVGPARVEAELVADHGASATARVALVDEGADGKVFAVATVIARVVGEGGG